MTTEDRAVAAGHSVDPAGWQAVLDEATARIDPETEARLDDAVHALMRGRTTVIIAHRLTTLRRVDEIAVFDHGRLVEHGDRGLLARDGKPLPGIAASDFKDAVTLVNVWASWCVPCHDEAPLLNMLSEDSRIRVVGINYKDAPDNARRFLGRYGNPFDAVGVDGVTNGLIHVWSWASRQIRSMIVAVPMPAPMQSVTSAVLSSRRSSSSSTSRTRASG